MKITLYNIGKTDTGFLKQGIDEYVKRLGYLIDFAVVDIPNIKKAGNAPPSLIKSLEGDAILKATAKANIVILLDDKGKSYTSKEFSSWIAQLLNRGVKSIAFVSGGAWGFSNEVYQSAQSKISLSKMTFTHQMVRLIFVEQLYRAFTILKGIPYHND